MAEGPAEHAALLQRLQRAGYVIGDEKAGNDGVIRTLVGEQWLSVTEMIALSSQDSEEDEKL